jgi:hypothetical protein
MKEKQPKREPINARMYDALKRISSYTPPEKIRKLGAREWGLDDASEAIEFNSVNTIHRQGGRTCRECQRIVAATRRVLPDGTRKALRVGQIWRDK